MKNKNSRSYFAYRIRIEKLKQVTWTLIIIARLLLLLCLLASR